MTGYAQARAEHNGWPLRVSSAQRQSSLPGSARAHARRIRGLRVRDPAIGPRPSAARPRGSDAARRDRAHCLGGSESRSGRCLSARAGGVAPRVWLSHRARSGRALAPARRGRRGRSAERSFGDRSWTKRLSNASPSAFPPASTKPCAVWRRCAKSKADRWRRNARAAGGHSGEDDTPRRFDRAQPPSLCPTAEGARGRVAGSGAPSIRHAWRRRPRCWRSAPT